MSSEKEEILARLRADIEEDYKAVNAYLKERSEVFEELIRVQDEVR